MTEKPEGFRELFIEELAGIRGGDHHLPFTVEPLQLGLCSLFYTTMACGEEYGPCAPSGC